ncbi:MAG: carboxypeptidase-like regulatory domain-containing protein [Bacteroidota bacterium]
MRFLLSLVFFLFLWSSFSQNTINGVIRDAKTGEALPFSSIAVKSTARGTIANAEGYFTLASNLNKDTLVFSYLGFDALEIPAKELIRIKTILLKRKDILLQEVVVHSNDDYLYEILNQCRKNLLKYHNDKVSKVYYGIETQTKDQPVELLECYYNGCFNGASISSLLLKNGRIGIAEMDKRYFLTLNSSKGISQMSLVYQRDDYPSMPLQMTKKEAKKLFKLSLGPGDNETVHITFNPRKKENAQFSGDLWIDRKTGALLKSDLLVKNAEKHPFLPLFPADSICSLDLNITHTFEKEGLSNKLDHINFSYRITYKSVRDTPTVAVPSIIKRDIMTRGIMYFYDYGNPFILPFFEYDKDVEDYRKISIIPYNDFFWDNNNTLVLTDKQKENLGFLAKEGYLVNYRDDNFGNDFLRIRHSDSTSSSFYECNYYFWSPAKRIMLNRKLYQNRIYPQEKINNSILSNLYSLNVQFLLDVTQKDGTYNFRSYTVFDAVQTFYHLEEEPETKAFLNIFFDICEIERRRMENQLNSSANTIQKIDSIYKDALNRKDEITKQYLKEVKLGKARPDMAKWNDYVFQNLGIDNLKQ